jgi:hypothetical protein
MFTLWSPSKNQRIDGISEWIFPQKVFSFPCATLLDLERTEEKFSSIRGRPLDTENLVDKRRSSDSLSANRRCWTTTHFVVIRCRQTLISPVRTQYLHTWSEICRQANASTHPKGLDAMNLLESRPQSVAFGDSVIKTYCMTSARKISSCFHMNEIVIISLPITVKTAQMKWKSQISKESRVASQCEAFYAMMHIKVTVEELKNETSALQRIQLT